VATIALDKAARRMGLEINQAKTKYMICCTNKKYQVIRVFSLTHHLLLKCIKATCFGSLEPSSGLYRNTDPTRIPIVPNLDLCYDRGLIMAPTSRNM